MSAGTSTRIPVEQRSVVLVPFPFSDLSNSKKRPALVISNTEFNNKNEDVVCCLITSNPHAKDAIKIVNKDMEYGFLEFDSAVKAYRLFTVSKTIVYKTLGKLSREKSSIVAEEVKKLIGIP